jgi:hypothetical protein
MMIPCDDGNLTGKTSLLSDIQDGLTLMMPVARVNVDL